MDKIIDEAVSIILQTLDCLYAAALHVLNEENSLVFNIECERLDKFAALLDRFKRRLDRSRELLDGAEYAVANELYYICRDCCIWGFHKDGAARGCYCCYLDTICECVNKANMLCAKP